MPFKDPARMAAYQIMYAKYRRKRPPHRGCYDVGQFTSLYETLSDLLDTKHRYSRNRLPVKIVKAVVTAMTKALQQGDYVRVRGFGTFWIKTSPPRKRIQASSGGGLLPPTGHFIADLPERKHVMFRPHRHLLNFINESPS